MTTNPARSEEAVFLAAMQLATAQVRVADVHQACAEDSALCSRMLELLAAARCVSGSRGSALSRCRYGGHGRPTATRTPRHADRPLPAASGNRPGRDGGRPPGRGPTADRATCGLHPSEDVGCPMLRSVQLRTTNRSHGSTTSIAGGRSSNNCSPHGPCSKRKLNRYQPPPRNL